jgi:hypothetical protein
MKMTSPKTAEGFFYIVLAALVALWVIAPLLDKFLPASIKV